MGLSGSSEHLFAEPFTGCCCCSSAESQALWLEIQRSYILLGLTVPMEMPDAAEKMRSQSSLESMKRATFF